MAFFHGAELLIHDFHWCVVLLSHISYYGGNDDLGAFRPHDDHVHETIQTWLKPVLPRDQRQYYLDVLP